MYQQPRSVNLPLFKTYQKRDIKFINDFFGINGSEVADDWTGFIENICKNVSDLAYVRYSLYLEYLTGKYDLVETTLESKKEKLAQIFHEEYHKECNLENIENEEGIIDIGLLALALSPFDKNKVNNQVFEAFNEQNELSSTFDITKLNLSNITRADLSNDDYESKQDSTELGQAKGRQTSHNFSPHEFYGTNNTTFLQPGSTPRKNPKAGTEDTIIRIDRRPATQKVSPGIHGPLRPSEQTPIIRGTSQEVLIRRRRFEDKNRKNANGSVDTVPVRLKKDSSGPKELTSWR